MFCIVSSKIGGYLISISVNASMSFFILLLVPHALNNLTLLSISLNSDEQENLLR